VTNEERVVRIKKLLEEMTGLGIIRVTYDPDSFRGPGSHSVEIWSRAGHESKDRVVENLLLTREEKEFYASEYDKCFGTAPRSDDN
jgi:hypothetical protein